MKRITFFLVIMLLNYFNQMNADCACDCSSSKQGRPGSKGQTGPTGPTGPPGPAGSITTLVRAYGSFYLIPPDSTLDVADGDAVTFTNTALAVNSSLTPPDTIVIDLSGNYLVTYGVSVIDLGSNSYEFKLTLNGTDVPGSFISFVPAGNLDVVVVISCSLIVQVPTASSTLQLINISGRTATLGVSLSLPTPNPDIAAYITLQRVED